MADVIATVRSALSDEVVQRLATAFGEDAGAVRKGLDAAVPGALGSLTAKSQTAEGATEVVTSLRDAQVAPALLTELPNRLDGVKLQGRAAGLGVRALGERGPTLADRIAGHAGVKASTASSLVDLAVPLVLAALAKTGGDLSDAGRVRTFLVGQEASVKRAMPSGFEPFIGVSQGGATPAAGAANRNWLWWLLGLLLLLALLFLLLRACNHPAAVSNTESNTVETTTTTTTTNAVAAPAGDNAMGSAGTPVPVQKVTLPNGQIVDVRPNTLNYTLQKFLSSSEAAPRTFQFETLHYNTDSSALGPEDEETIAALATILKAYPKAVVRLDGHTDETGTHDANVDLSKRRAGLVAAALQKQGIDAGRISAVGHAETQPTDTNKTASGRAENRRTELTVTAK